jgi:hypothetical protein
MSLFISTGIPDILLYCRKKFEKEGGIRLRDILFDQLSNIKNKPIPEDMLAKALKYISNSDLSGNLVTIGQEKRFFNTTEEFELKVTVTRMTNYFEALTLSKIDDSESGSSNGQLASAKSASAWFESQVSRLKGGKQVDTNQIVSLNPFSFNDAQIMVSTLHLVERVDHEFDSLQFYYKCNCYMYQCTTAYICSHVLAMYHINRPDLLDLSEMTKLLEPVKKRGRKPKHTKALTVTNSINNNASHFDVRLMDPLRHPTYGDGIIMKRNSNNSTKTWIARFKAPPTNSSGTNFNPCRLCEDCKLGQMCVQLSQESAIEWRQMWIKYHRG